VFGSVVAAPAPPQLPAGPVERVKTRNREVASYLRTLAIGVTGDAQMAGTLADAVLEFLAACMTYPGRVMYPPAAVDDVWRAFRGVNPSAYLDCCRELSQAVYPAARVTYVVVRHQDPGPPGEHAADARMLRTAAAVAAAGYPAHPWVWREPSLARAALVAREI